MVLDEGNAFGEWLIQPNNEINKCLALINSTQTTIAAVNCNEEFSLVCEYYGIVCNSIIFLEV